MKTVNIGMIGLGFMAGAHASCYRNDLRVRIGKAAEVDEKRRNDFSARFGVQDFVADWKDLVQDPSIDVIDITSPNFTHAEIAVAALEAGKAVVVEKPLALTLEDGRKVLDALRRHPSATTLYAENRLFSPVYRKAKELLAGGELGDPMILRVNELGSGPTHSGWFWDKTKTGGGALIDLGIHGLCMSEWLLGSPIVSVQAVSASERWKEAGSKGIEDTVVTNARFKNGAVGQFICSWAVQGGLDIRTEIFGTKGTALLDQSVSINGIRAYRSEAPDHSELRPHTASQTGWSYPPVDEWNVKGHSFELRHFVDCFLAKKPTESPLFRGYRAIELVHLIYEAARTRGEIAVPEPMYE